MRCTGCLAFAIASSLSLAIFAQEPAPEFSGPQVGERLTPFTIRGVLGDAAGKEIDPVAQADGKPLVLFFVHEVTRPNLGLARMILDYAATRKDNGLQAALVHLSADATETEQWMRRAAHALPSNVPVGIAAGGAEGPGAYGLNRKVGVTVIVAKEGKVTANFAFVQPSIAADGPKIAAAIAEATGGTPPTLEELQKLSQPMRRGR
jgi:hypothetical protein